MNAVDLLARLERLGVTATVKGDRLRLEPIERIPPEMVEELRRHKPEILAALTAQPTPIEVIFRQANRLGVSLRLAEIPGGGWTFIASPASAVTPAMRDSLTRNTAVVLAELVKNNLCRAAECHHETFIYTLDGDQESVTLCEHHRDHCAAPGCDRGATFASARTGLLYCRLDHMDASEGTR